jgi:Uncharacterized protein conserved in cyanobacteria
MLMRAILGAPLPAHCEAGAAMSVASPSVKNMPTQEELFARWEEVLCDPVLRNLPYRLELNKWGYLEMTPPASPRHMDIASGLVTLLRDRLAGKAFTECVILTLAGVRVADVVWCSPALVREHREAWNRWAAALPRAPELCIEVISPSNTYAELHERIQLYLEAGANEAWMLRPDGVLEVFGPTE